MATRVAILPQAVSKFIHETQNASGEPSGTSLRFLRLNHPRTGLPCLYLPKPAYASSPSQLLEVNSVAPDTPRSWFIGQTVVSDGKLLLLTPVDPAFILLPILRIVFSSSSSHTVAQADDDRPSSSQPSTSQFRTLDDIFEEASIRLCPSAEAFASQESQPTHLSSPLRPAKEAKGKGREDRPLEAADVLAFGKLDCVKDAMKRVCEVKEIGELLFFRYSEAKFFDVVRSKVDKLSNLQVFSSFKSLQRNLGRTGLLEDDLVIPAPHQNATEGEGEKTISSIDRVHLATLARQKASIDVIGQYLPLDLVARVTAAFDFIPLEKHLASVEASDALQAHFDKPVDAPSKGKAKKGSAKEEAKIAKKASNSRGVEQLKKVDTKGMNKLSSFFKKK